MVLVGHRRPSARFRRILLLPHRRGSAQCVGLSGHSGRWPIRSSAGISAGRRQSGSGPTSPHLKAVPRRLRRRYRRSAGSISPAPAQASFRRRTGRDHPRRFRSRADHQPEAQAPVGPGHHARVGKAQGRAKLRACPCNRAMIAPRGWNLRARSASVFGSCPGGNSNGRQGARCRRRARTQAAPRPAPEPGARLDHASPAQGRNPGPSADDPCRAVIP